MSIATLQVESSWTKNNPSIFSPYFLALFLAAYCLLFTNFMIMQGKKSQNLHIFIHLSIICGILIHWLFA